MDEPTVIEGTEASVPVRTSTYIIEADRLKGELPDNESLRLAVYKWRAPLGDAEFYLAVVDLTPQHRQRLEALRAEMAQIFAIKGKIPRRYAIEVQAIMRQDRALRPPQYNGELSRRVLPCRHKDRYPDAGEYPYLERTTAIDPFLTYLPCGEECRFSGEYGPKHCRQNKPWAEHTPRIPADDTVADPRD